MSSLILSKTILTTELSNCHKELSKWEERYRNVESDFYKKSYQRQIHFWQAKLETLRWVLDISREVES